MTMLDGKIVNFRGEHKWLSNFYTCKIIASGITYTSVETAYQAYKTPWYEERLAVAKMTPSQAKAWGKTVKLPEHWDKYKQSIMFMLLEKKFDKWLNPGLYKKLVATKGTWLEEGNWWGDTYWGVCDGIGSNYLGKMLMVTREWNTGDVMDIPDRDTLGASGVEGWSTTQYMSIINPKPSHMAASDYLPLFIGNDGSIVVGS